MNRHATDLVSLVFGLAFVTISAWWLTARFINIDIPHAGWFAATALIVLGLVGVVVSLRSGRDTVAAAPATAIPMPAAAPTSPTAPTSPATDPDPADTDTDVPGAGGGGDVGDEPRDPADDLDGPAPEPR
jgi:hypothetical protein